MMKKINLKLLILTSFLTLLPILVGALFYYIYAFRHWEDIDYRGLILAAVCGAHLKIMAELVIAVMTIFMV